jgi:hypothetical protein
MRHFGHKICKQQMWGMYTLLVLLWCPALPLKPMNNIPVTANVSLIYTLPGSKFNTYDSNKQANLFSENRAVIDTPLALVSGTHVTTERGPRNLLQLHTIAI